MQALCSQCSTRIQIDDAKVPDRPFKVRCPKCQTVLTLPGRGADAPAAAEAPAASEAPAPPPPEAAPPAWEPPPPPSPAAAARRERAEAGDNDALIAMSGPAAARPAPGPREPQVQRRLGGRRRGGGAPARAGRLRGGDHRPDAGRAWQARDARAAHAPAAPRRAPARVRDPRRAGVPHGGRHAGLGGAGRPRRATRPTPTAASTSSARRMAERKRLYQPLVDARRRIESE